MERENGPTFFLFGAVYAHYVRYKLFAMLIIYFQGVFVEREMVCVEVGGETDRRWIYPANMPEGRAAVRP